MQFFVEFLMLIFRYSIILVGALLSYVLGESAYRALNATLYTHGIPCLEILSFIVALLAPTAFFYGLYHQKAFFRRSSRYNFSLLCISYAVGLVMTLLPGQAIPCPVSADTITTVSYVLSTGAIASLITFLSFDAGVFYHHTLGKVVRTHKQAKKKASGRKKK